MSFGEFVGQQKVCGQLQLLFEVVCFQGCFVDYIFFVGFLGFGKIIFVMIVVYESDWLFWLFSGLVIQYVGDFVVLLLSLVFGEVFFIDEIYCMVCFVEEMLYFVMEDYWIDIMVGKGVGVMSILFEFLFFMFVGVMMCFGLLFNLFCDWFGFIGYFEFYEEFELEQVIVCLVVVLGVDLLIDLFLEIVW